MYIESRGDASESVKFKIDVNIKFIVDFKGKLKGNLYILGLNVI